MNVLLVDDHPLFRRGLRHLLSDLDESIRFLEADGIAELGNHDPKNIDLVLLDLGLKGLSGLQALAHVVLQLTDCSVVVLSSEEDPRLIKDCISHGAAGFIPKSSTPEILVHALKLVVAGGIYLPTGVLKPNAVIDQADGGSNSLDALNITPRQQAALMLAVQGKSNKLIARELKIAEGTVKLHLTAAFRALNVSNRTEAVYAAANLGILPPNEEIGI
ncbi:MAG: response regulator transcription factor [Pseudomonadota bacterium]